MATNVLSSKRLSNAHLLITIHSAIKSNLQAEASGKRQSGTAFLVLKRFGKSSSLYVLDNDPIRGLLFLTFSNS